MTKIQTETDTVAVNVAGTDEVPLGWPSWPASPSSTQIYTSGSNCPEQQWDSDKEQDNSKQLFSCINTPTQYLPYLPLPYPHLLTTHRTFHQTVQGRNRVNSYIWSCRSDICPFSGTGRKVSGRVEERVECSNV